MGGGFGPVYGGPHYFHPVGPPIAGLVGLFLLFCLFLLLAGLIRGGQSAAAGFNRRRAAGLARRALEASRPVRASNAERDATAKIVSEAVGEGRLSVDEAGERIDAVLRARHRHELARIVADLPRPQPQPRTRPAPAVLVIAAAVVLAALLLQAIAGSWALWPLAVGVLGAMALRPRR